MANKKEGQGRKITMDYYQPAFAALHSLLVEGEFEKILQRKREHFWGTIPGSSYKPKKGAEILSVYADSIKRELKSILSYDCLEYWMHIYRRLSPGQISNDSRAASIGRARQLLDLAIAKYSFAQPCVRIGMSTAVGRERILNGFLMADEYKFILDSICENEQLVLTDFGLGELKDLYLAEAYAGELARVSSCIRTVLKGASLFVRRNPADYMANTSDELHGLLKSFDGRNENGVVGYFPSAAAVVSQQMNKSQDGLIIIPCINVRGKDDKVFAELSAGIYETNFEFLGNAKPNFLLIPFDLKSYYIAHKPLSINYAKLHGVAFDAVVSVIFCASRYAMARACRTVSDLFQLAQRGYLCAESKDFLLDIFVDNLESAKHALGIDSIITRDDLSKAYDVMALTEEKIKAIDLRYPGPFFLFSSNTEGVMLDYSHLVEILHDLFLE